MPDIVSPEARSRMMAGIRGKDTKPELFVRRALHRAGFRYRLHVRTLPGKPDIVLPGYHAVVLVHGCFWHGHDCHLFKWPGSRVDFWKTKIARNRQNDERQGAELRRLGWRVLVIWECALKGRTRLDPDEVVSRSVRWLKGTARSAVIAGRGLS